MNVENGWIRRLLFRLVGKPVLRRRSAELRMRGYISILPPDSDPLRSG